MVLHILKGAVKRSNRPREKSRLSKIVKEQDELIILCRKQDKAWLKSRSPGIASSDKIEALEMSRQPSMHQ